MKYSIYIYIVCIMLAACGFMLAGCSNEVLVDGQETYKGKEVVLLRIDASGKSADSESQLKTLRVFIFAHEVGGGGRLVVNQLFKTSDASSDTPSGNTYFVKEKGEDVYDLSQLLQKATIRIMVVANELTSLSGITTETGVLKHQMNFYSQYSSSGSMDIQIADKGIPMFSSTAWLTPEQWGFNNGKTVDLPLVRTLAKVTMQLAKDGERTETFTNAFITNIPQFTLLGDSVTTYASALVHTKAQALTFSGGGNTSASLSFYVPEYVISDVSKYAYIQINAQTTIPDNGILTYKIPLGNGVQQLYGTKENGGDVSGEHTTTEEEISKLSPSDLKVSRNKEYNYFVVASSGGSGSDQGEMVVVATPSEWQEGSEVGGDINPPSLVLSSIDWNYKETGTNRIYYWSNVEVQLLSDVSVCKKDGSLVESKTQIDVFTSGLTFTSFTNGALQFDHNGYVDFILNDTWLKETDKIIKLTFNAGGLKKEVIIRPPLTQN